MSHSDQPGLTTTWRIVLAASALLPAASLAITGSLSLDPLVSISTFFGTWMVALLAGGIAIKKAGRGLGWMLLAVLFLNLPLLIPALLPNPKAIQISGPEAVGPMLESVLRWRERADRAKSFRGRSLGLFMGGFILFMVSKAAFSFEIGSIFVIAVVLASCAIVAGAAIWIASWVVGGTAEPRYQAFREYIATSEAFRDVAVEYLERAIAEEHSTTATRAIAATNMLADLGGEAAAHVLQDVSMDHRPEDRARRLEEAQLPPLKVKRKAVRRMEVEGDVSGLVEVAKRGGLVASLTAGKALLNLGDIEGLDALLNDTDLARYHERAASQLEMEASQPAALSALRRAADHPDDGEPVVNEVRRKCAKEVLARLPAA